MNLLMNEISVCEKQLLLIVESARKYTPLTRLQTNDACIVWLKILLFRRIVV